MGQSGTKVSVEYGIHSEDVISVRVVIMTFVGDIVEIGKVFRESTFSLTLLQDVLTLIPIPGLVNFSKVLNDQVIALDSLFPLAENTQTFRMDSKVFLVFAIEVLNSAHDYRSELFFHFIEGVLGIVDDVVKSSLNIKAVCPLLLDGKH